MQKEGLPYVRFGKIILFPKLDFDEWLKNKTQRVGGADS
jgi:hypothetical protein